MCRNYNSDLTYMRPTASGYRSWSSFGSRDYIRNAPRESKWFGDLVLVYTGKNFFILKSPKKNNKTESFFLFF